jgi:hypothetical protein
MHKLTKRCPVCNSKMLGYTDITAGTVCEDVEQCTLCNYYYEYMYGHTTISVNQPLEEFRWSYNTPWEEAKPIQDAYQLAIRIARERRDASFNSV